MTKVLICTLTALMTVPRSSVTSQAPIRRVIARTDTIVRGSAAHLDSPSEVLVANGQLYLLNAGNQLFVYDTLGRSVRTIGRDGAGPGELRQARSLSLVGGQLAILNVGNSRVEMYDGSGKALPSRKMPEMAFGGAVAIDAHGAMLVNSGGVDSTRAELFAPDGRLVRKEGAFAARPPAFDMKAMKAEIAKGVVPLRMKVAVLPVPGDNGDSWLVGIGESDVSRFDQTAKLAWTTHFDTLPEMNDIRRAFFADNRSEANANKLFSLASVVAARARGDRLYMLLRMPEDAPARIVVLDGAGKIISILEFPTATGIRSFDLSADGRAIYLLDYYGDLLLRARVGESALKRN